MIRILIFGVALAATATAFAATPRNPKTTHPKADRATVTLICTGMAPRYTRGWGIAARSEAMERAEKDTRIVVELNEDAGLLTTSIPFLLNTPPMKLHVSDTVYSGKAKLESEWFGIKEVSISINRQSGQGVSMYGVGDDIFTAFSGFCVLSEKL